MRMVGLFFLNAGLHQTEKHKLHGLSVGYASRLPSNPDLSGLSGVAKKTLWLNEVFFERMP
jgi:hypothetical protein